MHDNVELDLLEANELIFNIAVDGANVPPRARMVIESKDVSFCFDGKQTSTPGNMAFYIPEGVMSEGLYPAHIEVIVGNKILVPMKFSTLFKGSVKANFGMVSAAPSTRVVEATVKMLPVKRNDVQRQGERQESIVETRNEQVERKIRDIVEQGVQPQERSIKLQGNNRSLKARWLDKKK